MKTDFGSIGDDFPSRVFSALKCDYGWNGMHDGETAAKLDELVEAGTCFECTVKAAAALLWERMGVGCFIGRRDGRPNLRSVSRDREGCVSVQ